MNQHKQLKEIWQLEALLHRMQGKSNHHQERKVILKQLEALSNEIKKK